MLSVDDVDLVVGSTGFLGRNLVPWLEAAGRRVAQIGRHDGDLSDSSIVERLFSNAPKANRIFHIVTRQRTGPVQFDIQGELLAINARIHLNVLEAWRRFQPQAKLISTGSSCTYPESSQPLPEEKFGLGPTHPSVVGYAQAKQLLATGSAAYAKQYGMAYLHCVLATMYGPHDHKAPERSHFVGALLDRAVRDKTTGALEFQVWGNPETTREVLHVDDQIEALLAADRVFSNTIINCAANIPITVGEVARAVMAALDWPVQLTSPEGSFQGTAYKMLDSSRFLAATGWRPRITLDEGLRRLLAAEYGTRT